MSTRTALVAAAFGGLSISASALAVVNPFTETFDSSLANWSQSAAFVPLNYLPAGGPDGSAYGSRGFSFANSPVGDQPLLFRAGGTGFSSSGNAFVGNWVTSGVTSFSFSVRHDAPVALDFFARFAPPGPGIVALLSQPVQPNTWTTFIVPIAASTPFIYETFPAPAFESAFANIARVQIGVLVGQNAAGLTPSFTFDIDNVSIVPAPAAAGLLGLAAVGAGRRRRR